MQTPALFPLARAGTTVCATDMWYGPGNTPIPTVAVVAFGVVDEHPTADLSDVEALVGIAIPRMRINGFGAAFMWAVAESHVRSALTRMFAVEAENGRLRQENRSLRIRNEQLDDRVTDAESSVVRIRIATDQIIAKLRKDIEHIEARQYAATAPAGTPLSFGYTEGAACNRGGCTGTIILNPNRNCSCHLGHAPCSGCSYRSIICSLCDALPDSENI